MPKLALPPKNTMRHNRMSDIITLYNPSEGKRYLVRGKCTCTVDMCIANDIQQENNSAPIGCKDISQALHKRNLLKVTESIHLSPNVRF